MFKNRPATTIIAAFTCAGFAPCNPVCLCPTLSHNPAVQGVSPDVARLFFLAFSCSLLLSFYPSCNA
jgi:hypothetical protein